MKRLITGLLALLLAASPAAAQEDLTEEAPEPRRYTVEVIVFTYAENVSVGTEVFPPDEPVIPDEELQLDELLTDAGGVEINADGEPIPVFSDAPDATDAADAELSDETSDAAAVGLTPINPVLLLADEFSLQRAAEQLERLDAYEPILHTGWTQATLPPEESIALELPYFGAPPDGLQGSFLLYLGRYLHLVIDLTLDAAQDEGAENYGEPIISFGDERAQYEIEPLSPEGVVRYRIQEDRIIKNGDVRYFDHPKFGVIAKVTRVEEPEEDPATAVPPLVANPVQ